ncbi:palmitoyl-acyl carrier protein thioesterase, chloroplastic [Ziziphus jujuba]|uniref:Acyl-[acyl-carrier-protein] hydrolase n=1 Tax=Ziziphus jujuba TaxID=326968 RepID=A0ABM3I8N9_ZIZJJ|nr:palmitoyl-acyl carrier protein thioesterase, chloroplastic [Ziziphus jujuba]
MLTNLAAPRPFMEIITVPHYSTSASINKTTIITASCGGNYPNSVPSNTTLHFNVAAGLTKNQAIGKNFNLKPTSWQAAEKIVVEDIFGGRLLQGGLVFQQNFLIRVSELGPDCKASIEALINILQESAMNHFKSAGLMAKEVGASTPEMSRRNLIWVVYRMKIVVESYPSWADMIQVETWTCASGRNGMRRDWIVRDYKTGKTLLRAFCVYLMMNKRTRKLSKFIEEVREETKSIFMEITDPTIDDNEDDRKLRELDFDTADHVQSGLLPKRSDMDFNQHVNHVKYIDWILESVPHWILESRKMTSITLEFMKECGMDSVLESLCAFSCRAGCTKSEGIELEHTIRLQNQSHIILRGRTTWMPNHPK